uniref:Uncharacterized protein n=1 Tax=Physcomitrium patens TaxID=3218 RepID=A0A2K1IRE8_PHYPA|nr:hypothetical protein PHYPA_025976 [Physcomitrium patens]
MCRPLSCPHQKHVVVEPTVATSSAAAGATARRRLGLAAAAAAAVTIVVVAVVLVVRQNVAELPLWLHYRLCLASTASLPS